LSNISIRLKGENIKETLQFIKRTLKKIIPGSSFLYEFFDERLQSQYKGERRMEKLVRAMALLAILISCLGLFGLASFTAQQRTKEIGIRKVLGASVGKIMLLLTGEFSKWIIVANLIAWPVAYWCIIKWLKGFAYRAPIEFYIFFISGAMVLLLALFTVSYQSFKAARTNPVESLKYE
jgi:putative ABC transport system permease protein